MTECGEKLATIRAALREAGLGGVRLRGLDWFAWATAGGNATVLLAAETGIAEVLVTADQAVVLTDEIERERLREEELPAELAVWASSWLDAAARERFVREACGDGVVASDRPVGAERGLPAALWAAKRRLLPAEVERYAALGRDAAEAMTETLAAARPEWSETALAAAGASALLRRGIEPALILAGGEARTSRYGHPTATAAALGQRGMLVFCARRHGLYANLTRFVSFRAETPTERRTWETVAAIEAEAWRATRAGVTLGQVFQRIAASYAAHGVAAHVDRLHQGGTTGYLSREVVARPSDATIVEDMTALAWNPSLPGCKLEDTVLLRNGALHPLTVDPAWPTRVVAGAARPLAMVRS